VASGRIAFALATAAVAWAAAVTAWVLTASAYSDGQTILEANPETIVRIAVGFPLAATALVWVLLGTACRTNRQWVRICGLAAASVLVLFSVVTGFTIGMFVLPGAALLVVAAAVTPVNL
jgi:hypothetical protein